jgi:hypothetical protein
MVGLMAVQRSPPPPGPTNFSASSRPALRAMPPLGPPGKGAIRRHGRLGGVLGHYRREAA